MWQDDVTFSYTPLGSAIHKAKVVEERWAWVPFAQEQRNHS